MKMISISGRYREIDGAMTPSQYGTLAAYPKKEIILLTHLFQIVTIVFYSFKNIGN